MFSIHIKKKSFAVPTLCYTIFSSFYLLLFCMEKYGLVFSFPKDFFFNKKYCGSKKLERSCIYENIGLLKIKFNQSNLV